MKLKKSLIISLAVIFITIIFLFLFRDVPVSKIWNSYSVLYVQSSIPEETILSILNKHGVENPISLSNQIIPLANGITPVIPEDNDSYVIKRNTFFTDKSSAFRLFYIPQNLEKQTQKALAEIIATYGIPAGMDGKKQFPFTVPILIFICGAVFFILSKNKSAFIFTGISVLCLSLSNPFYSVAAGGILIMLSFFLFQRLWNRNGMLKAARKNIYIIFPAISGLLILLLTSVKCAILGLLVTASSCAFLILLNAAEKYLDSKRTFNCSMIFSARQIKIVNSKNIYVILITAIPLLAVMLAFLLQARFTPASGTKELSLPSPVADFKELDTNERLPNLDDYYKWTWKVNAYPYISLNTPIDFSNVKEGDKISIKKFKSTETGIEQYESVVLEYNENFKLKADRQIDKMPASSLEKFLKKQKKDSVIMYSQKQTGQGTDDKWSLILIIYAILVPFIMTIYYSIQNRKYYEKDK